MVALSRRNSREKVYITAYDKGEMDKLIDWLKLDE